MTFWFLLSIWPWVLAGTVILLFAAGVLFVVCGNVGMDGLFRLGESRATLTCWHCGGQTRAGERNCRRCGGELQ